MSVSWKVYIDFDNDGFGTGDDISNYVMDANWMIGMSNEDEMAAGEQRLTLTVKNADQHFSPEYSGGSWYGKWAPKRRMQVQSVSSLGTIVHWTGYFESIQPQPGSNSERRATIIGVGAKTYLENNDIQTEVLTNVTADQVIDAVWAYSGEYPPGMEPALTVDHPTLGLIGDELAGYAEGNKDANAKLRVTSGAGGVRDINTAPGRPAQVGSSNGNQIRTAQQFTPGGTGQLTQFKFTLDVSIGTPTGGISWEFREDASDVPGSLLITGGPVAVTASAENTVNVTDGPILDGSTKYWLVLYTQSQAPESHYTWASNTLDTYANHLRGISFNNGASWITVVNDTSFEVTTSAEVQKDKLAQSFQISSADDVRYVGIYLRKIGSPTGTLTLRIETNNAGSPSGTLVHANATATMSEADLTSGYEWKTFELAADVALSGSTTYWIVLSTSRSASSTNYVEWGADGSTPGYASGEMKYEASASWTAESKDAVFTIISAGGNVLPDVEAAFDLQAGRTIFPYVGDAWESGVTAYQAIAEATRAEQGRFYFDRQGRAIFWNGGYLQTLYQAQGTIDNAITLDYRFGDIVNDAEVVVQPRTISSGTNELLWQLEDNIQLKGGAEREIRARYTDANSDIEVSGREFQPLTITWAPANKWIDVKTEFEAKSAKITVRNPMPDEESNAITITDIQVRGQKLTRQNKIEIRRQNDDSVGLYGRRSKKIQTSFMTDPVEAESLAYWVANRRATAAGEVKSVTVRTRPNDENLAQMLTYSMGTVICVIDAQLSHDQDYVVIGEQHTLRDAMKIHDVTYDLLPLTRLNVMLVGITGRNEVGENVAGY